MTTSGNNTIMSWMAYTDFLSRLRIAAGILLPLNTRTLLYPGGRDCIGAAGVDAYPQTVEIYYNGIGFVDSQQQDMESLQPRKTEEPPTGIVNTITCRGIPGISYYPCQGGTKNDIKKT